VKKSTKLTFWTQFFIKTANFTFRIDIVACETVSALSRNHCPDSSSGISVRFGQEYAACQA